MERVDGFSFILEVSFHNEADEPMEVILLRIHSIAGCTASRRCTSGRSGMQSYRMFHRRARCTNRCTDGSDREVIRVVELSIVYSGHVHKSSQIIVSYLALHL